MQAQVKFIVISSDIVQILVVFEVVLGLIIVEGVLLQLGLRATLDARPLDRDLGRRSRRRMRFEKSTSFFLRAKSSIEQLKEDSPHNLVISRQLWRDAHLLQQRVGKALANLWPHF